MFSSLRPLICGGKRQMQANSIHLNSFGQILAILGLLICDSSISLAQSVLTDDAHTSSVTRDQDLNFGTNPNLTVSSTNNTYLKFKLSSTLPPGTQGSDIAKATLKLFVGNVSAPGAIDVVHLTENWSEKTITASNAPAAGDVIASGIPIDANKKGQ